MNEHPVLFFDGVCNLCHASVQFVIKHDSKGRFKFAALQSEYAKSLLQTFAFNSESLQTIVLLQNNKVYTQSDAALRIAKQLDGCWPMLYGFIVVPRFIRNWVYRLVAKNRYKWFGKQESCWLPSPDLQKRFL